MTTTLRVMVDVTFEHANTVTYVCAFSNQSQVFEYELREFVINKIEDPLYEVSISKLTVSNEVVLYESFDNINSNDKHKINMGQSYKIYTLTLVDGLSVLNGTTSTISSSSI